MSDAEQKPQLSNPNFREKLADAVFSVYGGSWGNALGAADLLLRIIELQPTRPVKPTEKDFGNPVDGDINKAIDDVMEDLMVGHNLEYAGKAFKELFAAHLQAAVHDSKKQEVRTLLDLRRHYDRLELNDTKDFENNKIATWSGYKHFRNPITGRLEAITGFRSDQEIDTWLTQSTPNQTEEK